MMTPEEIRSLRLALCEDRATFGARFARSARSVEAWEQLGLGQVGRRRPEVLALRLLEALAQHVADYPPAPAVCRDSATAHKTEHAR